MPIDSKTYGTVARVQTLVGDLAEGRFFGITTNPTLVEVEEILDDVASEIHGEMANAGYSISDTAATILASYPDVHSWLRNLNSVGAAAMVLDVEGYEAISGGEGEEITQTRSQRLRGRYNRLLKQIKGNLLNELGLAHSRSLTAGLGIGSYQDADGNVKKPFFTRGMTDFSGTRSLTE